MFHLLVSFRGWPDGAGAISTGRVYISADEEPGRAFLKAGRLDISKVSKIPALLVTETGGNGPQFAKVAHITSLNQGSSETAIQYAVDGGIQAISNQDLEVLAPQLGISKSTLMHTHWRIVDADLFKVMLLNRQKNAISPKVFSVDSAVQQDAGLVSAMMPFSRDFDATYVALQSAASAVGLRCVRADDFWEHHAVIQDIVNLIAKARVVVCDCTGRNPNVFYEIGIAHTLGKEVLIVTQAESDVPFDLRHLRFVHYLNNREGLEKLSEAVQSRLRTLLGLR
jgi:hypothetical protein